MKTPRDILLSKHQPVMPKLDAVRQLAVGQVNGPSPSEWFFTLPVKIWSELILPCRRIWTGLAVAWLFIVVVNVAQRDNINSVTGHTVSPDQVMVNPMTEQRMMNELLADRTVIPDADRHRTAPPKPHTAISPTTAL